MTPKCRVPDVVGVAVLGLAVGVLLAAAWFVEEVLGWRVMG